MNIANMHLVASLEEVNMVELLTPVGPYNRAQQIPRPNESGHVLLSNEPGLGQVWDHEWIGSHEIPGTRARQSRSTIPDLGSLSNF